MEKIEIIFKKNGQEIAYADGREAELLINTLIEGRDEIVMSEGEGRSNKFTDEEVEDLHSFIGALSTAIRAS